MRRPSLPRTIPLLLLVALPLAGCGEESTGTTELTVAEVAGTYAATTLVVAQGGATVDLLANGAILDVTLARDGTTQGRLFVPEGEEDGSDLDMDLTGTWTLSGDRVTFDHAADSFLRDVTFTYDADQLRAQFGQLQVVLTRRQAPQ